MTNSSPPRSTRPRLWIVVAAVSLALGAIARPRAGFETRYFERGAGGGREIDSTRRRVAAPLDETFADFDRSRLARVRYDGRLRLKHEGRYYFWVNVIGGEARLWIDGRPAARAGAVEGFPDMGDLKLEPGVHDIALEYRPDPTAPEGPLLSLQWAKGIDEPIALTGGHLFGPSARGWRFALASACAWAAAIAALFAALRRRLAPRRFRRLIFGLVAASASVLVFAVLAEFALRVLGVAPRQYVPPDIWRNYDFTPGAVTTNHGWAPMNVKEFEVEVRTNELGFRDRDYPFEKPEGVYRIVMLGDSYIEGREVELDRTIHKVLERRLNEELGREGRRFEVIALAKGGANTAGELDFLYRLGMKFQPDLVVHSFFPGNDIRENWAPLREAYDRWTHQIYRARVVRAKIDFLDKWIWIDGSYFNRFLVDRAMEVYIANLHFFERNLTAEDLRPVDLGVYRAGEFDATWSAAWDQTRDWVKQTRDVARDGGADYMMLIVHAILLDGFQAEWVEVGAVGGLDLDKPWRLIREFCEAEGLDYLDTGPPLEAFRETTGERYCWRYDAHWNEHGHRVAAEALFQYLAKTLGNE